MSRCSGFWRQWIGPIALAFLAVCLWLAAPATQAALSVPGPQQATSTPTSSQTTSPLPTPTFTPTPTQTPTASQTPTVTPTAPPNQLLCFKSSRQSGAGLLLAWQMSTIDQVADFRLFRAVVLGEGQRSQFIENSQLVPPIPPATAEPIQGTVLYTTTDSGAASGERYIYQIEVIGNDGAVLTSGVADSPPAGAGIDLEICDPTRTQPTSTPTATLTPVVFPTATHTATRTHTPTWTPTPTITPTPTWTLTPLPADTSTPLPTPTFTPTPTSTPEPATETPSPTFTITPTFTPNIQQPTAEFVPAPETGGFDNPPSQEIATDTPTLEPPPPPPQPIAALLAQTDSAAETGAPASKEDAIPENSPAADAASADAAMADTAMADTLGSEVQISDFPARLLPRGQANLFRYALFGVAGLAFLGAFGFLLAGVGFMRRG